MANSKKAASGGSSAKAGARDARSGTKRKAAKTQAAAGPQARATKAKKKTAKAAPRARKDASETPGTAARPRAKARKDAAKPKPEAAPRAPRRSTSRRATAPTRAAAFEPPRAVPGLSEEDQIRAAKFLPRELPKRLFEEERFLFPESYGQNRIRLLVRDPEWIFAYWDVKPESLEDLAKKLGERALALSRLTLRVVDPVSGGSSDILLPAGARWWYVRTDSARRTYRAELGVTLPSGEFRRLAESNTVVTPRVGPSPERARRRMSYRDATELAPAAAAAAGAADSEQGLAHEPWDAESRDGAAEPGATASSARAARTPGASDAFRPGGASDAFKR
jgi:hypothetical protein